MNNARAWLPEPKPVTLRCAAQEVVDLPIRFKGCLHVFTCSHTRLNEVVAVNGGGDGDRVAPRLHELEDGHLGGGILHDHAIGLEGQVVHPALNRLCRKVTKMRDENFLGQGQWAAEFLARCRVRLGKPIVERANRLNFLLTEHGRLKGSSIIAYNAVMRRRNVAISLFVILWLSVFVYETFRANYLSPFVGRPLPKLPFLFPPAGWIMFFHVDARYGFTEVYGRTGDVVTPIEPHAIFSTRTVGYDNFHRNILIGVLNQQDAPTFCRYLAWKFPAFEQFGVVYAEYPDVVQTSERVLRQLAYQCTGTSVMGDE